MLLWLMFDDLQSVYTKHYVFNQTSVNILSGEPIKFD